MNAAELRKYLEEEYGIMNEEDFEKVVAESPGVNLGLFTMPLNGGKNNDEKTDEVDVA